MDKSAIKRYAVWARRELIEKVSQKAMQYGIEEGKELNPTLDSINGVLLSDIEKKQRQALISKINEDGYTQVMEEVAYTWFNRFVALRFMETNGYLPSHVRVFSDENGNFKPQIMTEALHLGFAGLDIDKVYSLKNDNKDDELFKYLLIMQCNELSDILPGMFQKIEDYTELLLPDYLLREGSVIEQLVNQDNGIPESDWTDQVQIIGWLYQFYNIEPKDNAFTNLKKKIKISKETIGAATQLFTPDWIVHYMVENSLGRLWLEGHPNDALKSEWNYYLDEAEQETVVQAQLAEIRKEYATLKPEEIRVIDPCSGSGHILCVLFDVLVRIYEDYGYTVREAVNSIIKNNLWGLDIDERAAQLSYFTVMMKARQYDRRFLLKKDENGNPDIPQPHVYVVGESNNIDLSVLDRFVDGRAELKSSMETLMREMKDAKEYGSIVNVTPVDFESLYARINEIQSTVSPDIFTYRAVDEVLPLINVAQALAQKYQVVVTNPPYMATSNGSPKLVQYVKDNYKNSKADMFAVFIEKCMSMSAKNGFTAMITQHSWMFISTYEKLREKVLLNNIDSLTHLGSRAFEEIAGEVVQTVSFIRRNTHISNYMGVYVRLVDGQSQGEKEKMYLDKNNRYIVSSEVYEEIPGSPIAYWVGKGISKSFKEGTPLGSITVARNGMKTGDNERFLRLWWEVDLPKLCLTAHNAVEAVESKAKWFPYNKGGEARKWYGNNDYIVNWENSGKEIFDDAKKDGRNVQDYPLDMKFTPAGTWSLINTGVPTFRYKECNLSDIAGMSFYQGGDLTKYLIAFCNTPIAAEILQLLAPTINYQAGDIARLPILVSEEEKVKELAEECISAAKSDWDSVETSWDFDYHPMLPVYADSEEYAYKVESFYHAWEERCERRFSQLKDNEEALNRLFIKIYDLKDEVSPEVEEKYVTVRKADLSRDIKSLISFAVGCMFGRYNLWHAGIAYAGGEWNPSLYDRFPVDKDNIIPICDDEYFEDDIVGRFVEFIRIAYGESTLEENLRFIANALGGKGNARDVIRNYFINDFYTDHLKAYQKRPIYWLFDSGKKNGFKCLIYMHRYQPDTIARIRTDYVHEQQARYRTAIEGIANSIETASSTDKVKLTKKLNYLRAQNDEIHVYEEKIHHLADQMISINLDDGVKKNYEIFKDVLAKIK